MKVLAFSESSLTGYSWKVEKLENNKFWVAEYFNGEFNQSTEQVDTFETALNTAKKISGDLQITFDLDSVNKKHRNVFEAFNLAEMHQGVLCSFKKDQYKYSVVKNKKSNKFEFRVNGSLVKDCKTWINIYNTVEEK